MTNEKEIPVPDEGPPDIALTFEFYPTNGLHALDSDYVRDVWSAAIGPTAFLVIQRLLLLRSYQGDVVKIDQWGLGTWVGLRSSDKIRSSFRRLELFGFLVKKEPTVMVVHDHVPSLTFRQLEKVGQMARDAHAVITNRIERERRLPA